jgi:hypothetical protein
MAPPVTNMPSYKMTLAPVIPLLANLGFKKRADGIFTKELAPQVFGWIGLNTATRYRRGGEVQVNPIVGNHFETVQRIFEECRGETSKHVVSTASRPLCYLMPGSKGFKAWMFTPENAGAIAKELVETIESYGVPFMEAGANLTELRHRLDQGMGSCQEYLRPIIAMLTGDRDQARALLDEALAKLKARTDAAAVDLGRFADAFRARYLTT